MAKTDIIIPTERQIDVILQGNKDTKYNATELWKIAGSVKELRPYEYLRNEHAKTLLLDMYEELTGKDASDLMTGNKEALPTQVTEAFVTTYRGGDAPGTYLCEEVFLDYAGWLNVKVRRLVNKSFMRFKSVILAKTPEDAVRALVDITKEENAKIDAPMVVNTAADMRRKLEISEARLRTMFSRKSFAAAVAEAMHTKADGELGKELNRLTGHLNKHLLGLYAGDVQQLLTTSESIRAKATLDVLRAFEAIEDECCRTVTKNLEQHGDPRLEELYPLITKLAALHRAVIFHDGAEKDLFIHHRKNNDKKRGLDKGMYYLAQTPNKQSRRRYEPTMKLIEVDED